QAEELARVRPAGDEHELGHARLHERLDGVGDHRPVVDREQVLVRDPRQRIEPRALPTSEDDALHRPDATSARLPGIPEPGPVDRSFQTEAAPQAVPQRARMLLRYG